MLGVRDYSALVMLHRRTGQFRGSRDHTQGTFTLKILL